VRHRGVTSRGLMWVAIECEGVRKIHAAGIDGNYASLCGLDGEENRVSLPKRGEKIDCPQCFAIWNETRYYRPGDFAPELTSTQINPSPDSKPEGKEQD